ncbi:inositol polyphosphate 1-phosphatase isoform X3 [Cricetulus griseus]|uniref:inositol polyphosphate 1-phosphatase isoform X3 n=1 Tax=Cricetulus griseus TaxID=10029 RepID=UPI0004541867|nr:inositol polyphosphate 1-phosphatase isoform X3 [Cricetulus griseus]
MRRPPASWPSRAIHRASLVTSRTPNSGRRGMPSPAPEARGVTAPFHTTSRGRERAGTWQQLGCKTGSQESRAPPRLRCGDLRDPPKRSPSGCVRPRTPAPSPARPPPRVGTPFLLACPSSASSVSQGKAVASFWAPHPRLAESQRVGEASEMSDILKELLRVSEKAANIARACRQQETLFQLLIQEKKDEEKNKKFATDFKTLADVLVQEVIKQNMENKVRGQGQSGCETLASEALFPSQ